MSRGRAQVSGGAYASAGVDVVLGNAVKAGLGALVRGTHGPRVLGRVGGFGGLFKAEFPGMKEPVLVASMDGVGTKLRLAVMTGRHDTMGRDLVNHCVNDIAVMGAKPLFFLDYIGAGRLDPGVFRQILRGLASACRQAGCALLGGETAQMPGLYAPDDYDLVGCIVGVVDRRKLLDGSRVRPGDLLIGLPSSGFHTNGYSLVREILFRRSGLQPEDRRPGSRVSLATELLRVHRNYEPLMASLPAGVLRAAAHITGGGLVDNLPRVLPSGCQAVVNTRSWKVPRLMQFVGEAGGVEWGEMYRVFNMGLGMVLVVGPRDAEEVVRRTRGRVVGRIEAGGSGVVLER